MSILTPLLVNVGRISPLCELKLMLPYGMTIMTSELLSRVTQEWCPAFNGQSVSMDGDAVLLGIKKIHLNASANEAKPKKAWTL